MKLMNKLSSPLPQPLPKECEKAAKIFKSFVDSGNNGLDGVIPRSILENAKGFAIFTIVKAGFVVSARAGSGIVIARLDNGSWSAPSAIGTAGLGFGGQAGAEMTEFLVVLNSRSAIKSFMAAGSLTLGGNASIALGPLGRTGEASGALNTNGKVAAMYSYSKTKGLFGGVSIEGSVIVERQDANVQAYNSPVTARLLLGGSVSPPPWAMPLIKTLEACTGMPGGREWVREEAPQTPGGTYVFGGVGSPTSSRSPSFLRKKSKIPPPEFPPSSWGEPTESGSYFSNSSGSKVHSRNITWDGGNSSNSKNFDTSFESDYSPNPVATSRTASYENTNPFSPDSKSGFGSKTITPKTGSNFQFTAPEQIHSRSLSLDRYNLSSNSQYPSTNPYHSLTTPLVQSNLPAAAPILKTRDELARPLLPHEGVGRAIALFNFDAVEEGDLSFKKGQVITITKKSDSTDDWWTGKIDGRQGIFPANFVELA